jgi:hypothetical protein
MTDKERVKRVRHALKRIREQNREMRRLTHLEHKRGSPHRERVHAILQLSEADVRYIQAALRG